MAKIRFKRSSHKRKDSPLPSNSTPDTEARSIDATTMDANCNSSNNNSATYTNESAALINSIQSAAAATNSNTTTTSNNLDPQQRPQQQARKNSKDSSKVSPLHIFTSTFVGGGHQSSAASAANGGPPQYERNQRRVSSSASAGERSAQPNVSTTTTTASATAHVAGSSYCGESVASIDGKKYVECPLCILLVNESLTPKLDNCCHRVCLDCMRRYITTEINHSRLNITCPVCSEVIHPNSIKTILNDEKYYEKYEKFMLRRVLAAEPDARWCPAPDCGYVVLANACASCPRLVCGREGCNTSFCYHCKQEWHPNQTCTSARIQRNKRLFATLNIAELIEESNNQSTTTTTTTTTSSNNGSSTSSGGSSSNSATKRKLSKTSQHTLSLKPDDIKECPVCSSRIIKMNDGSCNHMTCSICETEFCWLCMKEISDLHYYSPSGCTFWGKKPWSKKKKLLWRLGMLVGAPICIIFIAGIAVPAIVIGIPVWAARKLHTRLEQKQFSKFRKNAIITGGVLLSFVISPIVSAVALAVGIPILLGYVYGVVPLSLCRSSGGCLSASPSVENLPQQYQPTRNMSVQINDVVSIDAAASNKLCNPSIGETSLYMSNMSLETNSIGQVAKVERDDRESTSNAALAGSIISDQVEDGNSTQALAGSIMSKESGYTLIPAEVHNLNQAGNNSNVSNNNDTITTTTNTTTSQQGQNQQQVV